MGGNSAVTMEHRAVLEVRATGRTLHGIACPFNVSADIMGYGISIAGQNPTRDSFIAAMLKVSSYDDNGLLPGPIGWDHLGKLAASTCSFYTTVKGKDFVPINDGKAICGS